MLNRYLDISTEVKEALDAGQARGGAGEHHHLPRYALSPECGDGAMNVEKIIRENGAVPATIAIIKGRLKAGLTAEEIDYLGQYRSGCAQGQPP